MTSATRPSATPARAPSTPRCASAATPASSTTSTRCGSSTPSSATGTGLNLTEQVRDGILNHTGSDRPATQEGRIVKLVDRVAYINHDIDDALRAGILREEDLPAAEIELLGPTGSAGSTPSSATSSSARDEVGRHRARARRSAGRCCGCGSSCSTRSTSAQAALREHERAHRTLRGLFDHYMEHPEEVPEGEPGAGDCQRVADYIAGMTDRYCHRPLRPS